MMFTLMEEDLVRKKKQELLEDIFMTLEELTKNKPTVEWKQRMDEYDDDIFTEENISATNAVLNSYTKRLIELKNNSSSAEIMDCVKEVVLKLNELNEKYDYYIDTMEREELCDFIIEAAQLVGLEAEEDITEKWREW